MLIIAGHAVVAEPERDEYVAGHLDLVMRCRNAAGCLDAAISADPVDSERINIFELWESKDALDAWRDIANAPDTGIEFDAADVQLFDVTDARSPFA